MWLEVTGDIVLMDKPLTFRGRFVPGTPIFSTNKPTHSVKLDTPDTRKNHPPTRSISVRLCASSAASSAFVGPC